MHPYHHPLFVEFLVYFNTNQDYFEGHEVLEEYWKSLPGFSKDHPLTAFILLTTGMYHWRRGNTEGARRTISRSLARLTRSVPENPVYREEIRYSRLLQDIERCSGLVRTGAPFEPFKIGIDSPVLARAFRDAARSLPLLPGGSPGVVHKHMHRDRSDILKLRDEKKKSGR